MGNHIHIFNTQAEYEANKQNITPPFIAHVKENNKMGMHADKTIGSLFNFQRKNVNITENGSFTIEPDSSYGALSSVNVKVNIGGSTPVTPSRPTYTGHADAEGLRAIGWTEEDIAYYQENGVNWNEEDDQYHLVSDDNKALYGVLTANNISTYKDRIVYLPKIDTSNVTSMYSMFNGCYSLVAIPMLDTSNVTSMNSMFYYCYPLTTIPMLDTSNVTDMNNMFRNCYSLTTIPQLNTSNVKSMSYMFNLCESLTTIPMLDTSNVTKMNNMFNYCYSLTTIPQLNTSNVTNMSYMFQYCHNLASIPQLNTSNVTDMSYMFQYCYNLASIPQLNTSNVTSMYMMFSNCASLLSIPQLNTSNVIRMSYMFSGCHTILSIPMLDTIKATSIDYMFSVCHSLTYVNLKNIKSAYDLSNVRLLSKDSIIYIINNEAATSAITIKLASYAYDRWATDADVVAALANHPNITLAK